MCRHSKKVENHCSRVLQFLMQRRLFSDLVSSILLEWKFLSSKSIIQAIVSDWNWLAEIDAVVVTFVAGSLEAGGLPGSLEIPEVLK